MTASIAECLQRARELVDSDSARLDTELLLCEVLGCGRSYLYTWPEKRLTEAQYRRFGSLMERRHAGRPVAHLLGRREFWGLELEVSDATLIPRPDTELLVELVLGLSLPQASRVLDLGTGTGAIALALACERPDWSLTGVELSRSAAQLAQRNVARLGFGNVRILQGDWYSPVAGERFHVVVSNPPYIAGGDEHLGQGDVRFEPHSALVSDRNGMADLERIVSSASGVLLPGGWLLVEHGYNQADVVAECLRESGFLEVGNVRDLGGQPRVSCGRLAG